ncbi:Dihydropteroate synthase [Marinobacterium lutimaris]|uniref:Dihydropteroate synthase n=2 Tax=Marinobacterium lutimaris TaxID=568106 RepID=A0A1H6D5A7_9GAMM|nr:Dihydropteroate synthase [Marinobacterium lutimaris]
MITELQCADRVLDLKRVQVMGILNVTPDSFSDGGNLYQASRLSVDKALVHAANMVADGASMIDVGGESTRPGASPVSVQEELDRVIPVVERIKAELDTVISVDTSAPEVMIESARAGAGLINDVRSLAREGAMEAAASTGLPVCIMHMQGATPATMQLAPHYDDVLAEVYDFLSQRAEQCVAAGIGRERIVLDPGFGFGKTLEHNLTLLRRMGELESLGMPILVGTSRKTMVGQALGREVGDRLAGSLATVALAIERGGRIIRVHDVAATADVVRMTEAVLYGPEQERV